MQDEKVHAGDFNIKDHDFPPLSCNMSVRNFLPSSDRSCKLVCANYVCKVHLLLLVMFVNVNPLPSVILVQVNLFVKANL